MATLATIPRELLDAIISDLSGRSLKALRRTCRALSVDEGIGGRLFDPLKVTSKTSVDEMKTLFSSPVFCRMPRKVYVDTCDENVRSYEWSEEKKTFPVSFKKTILLLKQLPNAQTVILRFDEGSWVDNIDYQLIQPQSEEYRTKALRTFFSWLAASPTAPRDIRIWDLQDGAHSSNCFHALIGKSFRELQSLQLRIAGQQGVLHTKEKIYCIHPYSLFLEMPSTWLNPAQCLRHLSLDYEKYYGFYPKLDLRDVFFPHLETLALTRFTFADDSQKDWILRHGGTLTQLSLYRCAILYCMGVYKDFVLDCLLDETEMESTGEDAREEGEIAYYRHYNGRWHQYFDAFRTGIPRLQHFYFGNTDQWLDLGAFNLYPEMKIELVKKRYLMFDGLEVMEAAPGIYEWERSPPGCGTTRKDRKALRLLLEKTGQRKVAST